MHSVIIPFRRVESRVGSFYFTNAGGPRSVRGPDPSQTFGTFSEHRAVSVARGGGVCPVGSRLSSISAGAMVSQYHRRLGLRCQRVRSALTGFSEN
jgi:hypothetical protein